MDVLIASIFAVETKGDCGARSGEGFTCSRERNHLMPHIAGINPHAACAIWDDDRSTD